MKVPALLPARRVRTIALRGGSVSRKWSKCQCRVASGAGDHGRAEESWNNCCTGLDAKPASGRPGGDEPGNELPVPVRPIEQSSPVDNSCRFGKGPPVFHGCQRGDGTSAFRMQQACGRGAEIAMPTGTKIPTSKNTSNNLAVRRCMVRVRGARHKHRGHKPGMQVSQTATSSTPSAHRPYMRSPGS